MEDEIKLRAKENSAANLKQNSDTQKSATREKVGETRKEVAKIAGVTQPSAKSDSLTSENSAVNLAVDFSAVPGIPNLQIPLWYIAKHYPPSKNRHCAKKLKKNSFH
ncbi:hypothetical protein LNN31_00510 [Acetobacterium wieringae]|uniref:Uncharacterized protein n=1 Tax=Acetobacterium wieringae TaxID=52694 RepID=A0ABY6HGE8_9FIRM|nr:hypothetical protein [Acetobacterium wieringae]UYO62964.1 hypothetical protein LNN31_00510 [Acetobacterium wieringae]